MRKILLVHQNFPGQFKHLGPALAQQGHQVFAFSMRPHKPLTWQGVRVLPYRAQRASAPDVHPWVVDFETKVIRAEAAFRHAQALKAKGLEPELILAHPGWGESLFLKRVWPQARLAIYCEYFYGQQGQDVGFDPEFPVLDEGDACRVEIKNINNLLHFERADAGLSPTQWQASSFPQPFRSRIAVIHDGIDTAEAAPRADARFALPDGRSLGRGDEVVTFVNRNLEPYRGYHVFMRSMPDLLARRPQAQVVLVGGDEVSYGARPPGGGNWKDKLIAEVRPRIPDAHWQRVHFVGKLAYDHYLALMQVSRVHVYLTYPFVLSWSLLEAMSVGAAIVASDTPPVREVITHDQEGLLVPFFDPQALVDRTCALLEDPAERARLGQAARRKVVSQFDLQSICLPAQLDWVNHLL
jgi:glycosyltransferase involved in cell wall biosynthesis